jgi:hypothetical protein
VLAEDHWGMRHEIGSTLEIILECSPGILKRVPTGCFRHRYPEVKNLVVRIQRENERIFREIRKEPWEWIWPLTQRWLAQLGQDVLANNRGGGRTDDCNAGKTRL